MVHNALVSVQTIEIRNMALRSKSSTENEEFTVNNISSAKSDVPPASIGIEVCAFYTRVEHNILAEVKPLVDILEISSKLTPRWESF